MEGRSSDIRLSLISNQGEAQVVTRKDVSNSVEEFRGSAFVFGSGSGYPVKSEDKHPTTVREFLAQNKKFYVYACITGIIWPAKDDNSSHSLTQHNLRYRLWALYLVTALFVSTLLMTGIGIWEMLTLEDVGGALFCETIGIVVQNIVLYPAVLYLRKEMDSKREIDVEVYTQALDYGVIMGRRLFVFCMIFLLSLTIANIVNVKSNHNAISALLIVVYLFLLTPTQYYLSGILSFLVMEQRISRHVMKSLQAEADAETLTRAKYFLARESIDRRDRHTPVNLLISSAMINFVLSLLLFFALSNVNIGKIAVCVDVFYTIAIFGKQFAVIIIILLEVVKVNEKCDLMIKSIAKLDWAGGVEANERQRLSLYVAAKEYPIGSTIFYIRPSKFQIMIHIGSMVLSAGAAVFWAFTL